MANIIQNWSGGIDNVLIGIIGFNPETFVEDFTANIQSLAGDLANLNLGDWQFNAENWNFEISPEFTDILSTIKEILENDDSSETNFIEIFDLLFVDFDAFSVDWLWFNEQTGKYEFDVEIDVDINLGAAGAPAHYLERVDGSEGSNSR